MGAQVLQDFFVDVELGSERHAKTRAPAARRAVFINEDVGLQRAKTLLAHLGAYCFDAIEAGDRRLVKSGVIDAPGCAMRPVNADAVAYFAAEQRVAGDPERLGLGVEERVLDRPQSFTDDAPGGRPRQAIEFGIDALVLGYGLSNDTIGKPLDNGADPGRAKPLIKFAPAGDTLIGRQLEKMVISPAGVTAKNFQPLDLHPPSPVIGV